MADQFWELGQREDFFWGAHNTQVKPCTSKKLFFEKSARSIERGFSPHPSFCISIKRSSFVLRRTKHTSFFVKILHLLPTSPTSTLLLHNRPPNNKFLSIYYRRKEIFFFFLPLPSNIRITTIKKKALFLWNSHYPPPPLFLKKKESLLVVSNTSSSFT